jgi:hypothetical protein
MGLVLLFSSLGASARIVIPRSAIEQGYGGNQTGEVINLPTSSFQPLGSYGAIPGTQLGDTSLAEDDPS